MGSRVKENGREGGGKGAGDATKLASSQGEEYSCHTNYSEIITIESGQRSGKPCIRGMRITVSDVLGYLASGMTEETILSDFPELTSLRLLHVSQYRQASAATVSSCPSSVVFFPSG